MLNCLVRLYWLLDRLPPPRQPLRTLRLCNGDRSIRTSCSPLPAHSPHPLRQENENANPTSPMARSRLGLHYLERKVRSEDFLPCVRPPENPSVCPVQRPPTTR